MEIEVSRRTLLGAMGAAGVAAALPAAAATRGTSLFKRAGKPLGAQIYALGDYAQKDLRGTLRRLIEIGYGDFELPGLYNRAPADLRADADAAGARFSSIHLAAQGRLPAGSLTLMSDPQQIADALGTLGVAKVVLPTPLVPENFSPPPGADLRAVFVAAIGGQGTDFWKRQAEFLNERATALRPHGIALGYHNHNLEFKPHDGTTGWAVMMKEIDPDLVFLELDLGWLAAAGLDPAAELRRYKGRVKMVHLKDIKASTKINYALEQDPAEVGEGKLNWREILPACMEAGVEHYFVEQEAPFVRDRFESMKMSHDFLARFSG
ncbi:MAG: sugar phosphate isomerase/epimerase [Sphingomonas bacterium]